MTRNEKRDLAMQMRNLAEEIRSAASSYGVLRDMLGVIDVGTDSGLRDLAFRADEAARTSSVIPQRFRAVRDLARKGQNPKEPITVGRRDNDES